MSVQPPRGNPRLHFATFAAVVALALVAGPLAQAESTQPASLSSDAPIVGALPSFSPLVKKVMPAVVNISATLKPNADLSDAIGSSDDQEQGQDQDQDQ